MSDARKPATSPRKALASSAVPASKPAASSATVGKMKPSGNGPPASPRRSPSSPSVPKVVTAARASAAGGPSDIKLDDIKEGAVDAALNVVGAAKDAWKDFLRLDRFLKYKLLIVGSWLVLSAAGFGVACPSAKSNDLRAEMTHLKTPGEEVVMIKNKGSKPWKKVTVEVNRKYYYFEPQTDPMHDVTVTPRQLRGKNSEVAPMDLVVTDVALETDGGRVELMRAGQPL